MLPDILLGSKNQLVLAVILQLFGLIQKLFRLAHHEEIETLLIRTTLQILIDLTEPRIILFRLNRVADQYIEQIDTPASGGGDPIPGKADFLEQPECQASSQIQISGEKIVIQEVHLRLEILIIYFRRTLGHRGVQTAACIIRPVIQEFAHGFSRLVVGLPDIREGGTDTPGCKQEPVVQIRELCRQTGTELFLIGADARC